MYVRKAVIPDVRAIHRILNYYGNQGLLLQRSLSELYDHLRDYYVVEGVPPAGPETVPGNAADTVVGVCGLGICWEDIAEVKSLAVREDQQGKGLGALLVEACLDEARHLGLKHVFTLTYVPGFFEQLGFKVIEKTVLPHKIWADCLKCPKVPDCDEIALMLDLA